MFQVTSHFFCTLIVSNDFANAQAELDVFSQWCIDGGMQLNLGKLKSMSFKRRHFQYELSGHRLDNVGSICDLGVVLDSKLNFTSNIDPLGCWVT
jgi:hypothetical protein